MKGQIILFQVEITGRVNSKGSTTNNKVVICNNESTLKHEEEPKTNANNRLDAGKQLPPTIPNTLKKKRRKTNRKRKVIQLYKS
jgi:hypothetical protein